MIFIPGIRTRPGDADGWTDRAVTKLMSQSDLRAEKFEYRTGALLRRIGQQARAQSLAKMVGHYVDSGYRIVMAGHSNGGDLIERVLALRPQTKFAAIYLFNAACTGERLLDTIHYRRVSRVYLYGHPDDPALKLGALSVRLFGWLGLGYGDLGRRVQTFRALPVFPADRDRITAEVNPTSAHGHGLGRDAAFEDRFDRMITRETAADAV